jgi:hypothetical protein
MRVGISHPVLVTARGMPVVGPLPLVVRATGHSAPAAGALPLGAGRTPMSAQVAEAVRNVGASVHLITDLFG